MNKPKRNAMDVMMRMQRNAWRERQSVITIEKPKVAKVYDASEIYDNPMEYSTVSGIFLYTGVDMISLVNMESTKIDKCKFYNKGFCIQYIDECKYRKENQRCERTGD